MMSPEGVLGLLLNIPGIIGSAWQMGETTRMREQWQEAFDPKRISRRGFATGNEDSIGKMDSSSVLRNYGVGSTSRYGNALGNPATPNNRYGGAL